MISLAALVTIILAAAALLATQWIPGVLLGALGAWLAVQAVKRHDDINAMFGVFMMLIVAMGFIRLLYAALA